MSSSFFSHWTWSTHTKMDRNGISFSLLIINKNTIYLLYTLNIPCIFYRPWSSARYILKVLKSKSMSHNWKLNQIVWLLNCKGISMVVCSEKVGCGVPSTQVCVAQTSNMKQSKQIAMQPRWLYWGISLVSFIFLWKT